MTAGYIVESDSAMVLDEQDGQLYFGRTATLFPTRQRAKKAVAATVSNRPTWDSEFKPLRIVRIETLRD